MTTYPGALAQTELPPSSAHEIIRHRNLLDSWLLRLFVLRIELPPSSAHDHSTRLFGLDKGSRFPDGLHAPSGDATIKQSPTTPDLSNVSITGHVDRYNPRSSLGGTIGHVVVDYGLGHLVQIFHKNLDRRCN